MSTAEELLNEISLKAFISLRQTFTGFVMAPELRKWEIEVDIRLNPPHKFSVTDSSLLWVLNKAKERVDKYYDKYDKSYLISNGGRDVTHG